MNIPQINNNTKQNLHKLMDILEINYIPKTFNSQYKKAYHYNFANKINAYWNDFGRFISEFNVSNTNKTYSFFSLCAINQIKTLRMVKDRGFLGIEENTWSPIEENISNDSYDGMSQLRIFINQILNLPEIQVEARTFSEEYYASGHRRDAFITNTYCNGFIITFPDHYLGYRYGPIANTGLRYEQLNSSNCNGVNFSNCDLRNTDFRNANLDGTNFTGANIEGACFYRAKISNPNILNLPNRSGPILNSTGINHASNLQYQDLINLNLSSYNLSNADLVGVRLNGSSIVHLNLNDENLKNTDLKIIDCSGLDLSGLNLAKLNNMPLRSFAGANLTKANNFKLIKNFNSIDWQQVNLTEVNLSGIDFSGINLASANLSKAIFNEQTKFSGANLQNTQLMECNLSGVDFNGANLVSANLNKCTLTKTKFSGANLQNAQLMECDLNGIDFSGVNLAGANLSKSNLTNTKFSGANLENVQLMECDLSRLDFSGVNLVGANLSKSNLANTKFSGCNKINTNFSYTINLTDCDLFINKDLSNIILYGIDFSNLSLANFNLQNTDLSGCVFNNTNLDQANLQDCTLKQIKNFASIISLKTCNLQRAKFIETDLNETDFNQMNLSGVNFVKSNLEKVNLSNCQLDNVVLEEIQGLNSLKIDHYQNMFLINLDFDEVNTAGKSFAGSTLEELKNFKRMGLLIMIDGVAFDENTTYEMVYEKKANLTLSINFLRIDWTAINFNLKLKNINLGVNLNNENVINQLTVYYAEQYNPDDKESQDFNDLPVKYLNSYLAIKDLEDLDYGIKFNNNIFSSNSDYLYFDKSYYDSWSEQQRKQIEQILTFWGYVKKADKGNQYYYELENWSTAATNNQINIRYIEEFQSNKLILINDPSQDLINHSFVNVDFWIINQNIDDKIIFDEIRIIYQNLNTLQIPKIILNKYYKELDIRMDVMRYLKMKNNIGHLF